jgi:hypothetical protein
LRITKIKKTNGQIYFAGHANVAQPNGGDRVEREEEAMDERPVGISGLFLCPHPQWGKSDGLWVTIFED